jgi:hypothetical protein
MTRLDVSEQDMIERLRGILGSGTFEAHVTVDADDLAARARFRALCAELGVKSVLIELPQGQTRSQPMTSSYHRGELSAVVEEVAGLARRLREQGFVVTRLKLEALVSNPGVPATDEKARAWPAGNYFEFHVKVTLPAGADLEVLRELCRECGAHLSRNALKNDGDGQTQRFVTQRVYGVGRESALSVFEDLLGRLSAAGHLLSNKLREYTLYDSNVAVDAGWIEAPPGVGNAGGGGSP